MLAGLRRNSKSQIVPMASPQFEPQHARRQPWLGRLKHVNPAHGALVSVTYSESTSTWSANYVLGRKDVSNVSCPLHKLPIAHVSYIYHNASKYIKLNSQSPESLQSVLADIAASRGFAIDSSAQSSAPDCIPTFPELHVNTDAFADDSGRPLTAAIGAITNKFPPSLLNARRNSRTAGVLGDHIQQFHQMQQRKKKDSNMQQIIDAWRCNTAFKGRICFKCNEPFSRGHVHGCDLLKAHLAISNEVWERFENDRREVPNEFVRKQFSIMDSLLNNEEWKLFEMLYSYLDFVLAVPKED